MLLSSCESELTEVTTDISLLINSYNKLKPIWFVMKFLYDAPVVCSTCHYASVYMYINTRQSFINTRRSFLKG